MGIKRMLKQAASRIAQRIALTTTLSLILSVFLVACGGGDSSKKDTTAPDIPSSPVVSVINGKAIIKGTAEPNSTIKATFSDGATAQALVGSDGKYTLTSSTTLVSNGEVILTATDTAGNTSEQITTSFTIPDDTVPPASPSQPTISILRGGKVTLAGTVEPYVIVKASFPDGSKAQVTADNAGQYTLTSPNAVVTNTNGEIKITATDPTGNVSPQTLASIPVPAIKQGTLIFKTPQTRPISGVVYKTSLYNDTGTTKGDGSYEYKEGETTVTFNIAGQSYSVNPSDRIAPEDLLESKNSDNHNNITISYLKLILINLDKDNNSNNGIDLSSPIARNAKINPEATNKAINKALYKITGNNPKLIFTPSLGINTEGPQAEADTAGQAMPFVDIFRTARPFAELSADATEFDENGWPTKLDPLKGYAKTKLLQGTLKNAIPSGKYTLLYTGNGKIELSGNISQVKNLTDRKGFTFEFNLKELDFTKLAAEEENALNLNIKNISPGEGNYIKNIQIIMPGGTCKHSNGKLNLFIHAESQTDCPQNTTYESFVEQTINKERENINSVIFNPDYLSFLREFKVVRMMNLMESSHGRSSCAINNEIDKDCVKEPVAWNDRAKLSDSVWGGSGRTPHTKRNGVPVEVIVALANTLQRDMWVNMPHYADDEYIKAFAEYVASNLDQALKTYVELSNETWNPGFLGHFYVEQQGIDAGLNTVPEEFEGFRDEEYFARLRFYSQRSVEIFNLWKDKFNGSTDRLIRVLGTNQGDKILSEQMIKHVGAENVDAIAMAPYFFGCPQKTGSCSNAPKSFEDAITVDDVFDIIDQDVSEDPSALSGTIKKIELQADITKKYNLQLITYEGGQHLTTSILGRLELNESEKTTYRALFKKANRDPRMKQRYETLLNAWKSFENKGTTLFTMYTLPQSFYRFGNWGLKEHLNKMRKESPKYDGVMNFQESMGKCWWDGCDN